METSLVESLTEESISRIHEVNKIRDFLKEKSEILKSVGIKQVLFFGSAMKGESDVDSDIDLYVVTKQVSDSFLKFEDEFREQKKVMRGILARTGKSVAFDSIPPDTDEKNIIHVTMFQVRRNNFGNQIPALAKDSIEIWTAKTKNPVISAIGKIFSK